MWDYTAGRTVGMLALELMILCFGVSVVVQLYLKDTPPTSCCWPWSVPCWCCRRTGCFSTICRAMRAQGSVFFWVVLPSALMTAPGSWLLHCAVRRISTEFKIDNGVV